MGVSPKVMHYYCEVTDYLAAGNFTDADLRHG